MTNYDTSNTSVEKLAKILALFNGISYEDALVVANNGGRTMTEGQKEARKRVAEALRSGKYTQCCGRLHKGDAFCFFGVACDLYEPKWAGEYWRGAIFAPPVEVLEWLGMSEDVRDVFMDANDRGTTFAELADTLEQLP